MSIFGASHPEPVNLLEATDKLIFEAHKDLQHFFVCPVVCVTSDNCYDVGVPWPDGIICWGNSGAGECGCIEDNDCQFQA
jgi:hypothetical protein